MKRADIAQSVECILGKDEVTGSNPVISSKPLKLKVSRAFSLLFITLSVCILFYTFLMKECGQIMSSKPYFVDSQEI